MPYDSPDTNRRPMQLSLDVKHHPEVERRLGAGEHVWLHGTLTTKIELPVREDYNMGDELMVTVTDADGQVVGRTIVEVESPHFKPIVEKGLGVIGEERVHKAVMSDRLPADFMDR